MRRLVTELEQRVARALSEIARRIPWIARDVIRPRRRTKRPTRSLGLPKVDKRGRINELIAGWKWLHRYRATLVVRARDQEAAEILRRLEFGGFVEIPRLQLGKWGRMRARTKRSLIVLDTQPRVDRANEQEQRPKKQPVRPKPFMDRLLNRIYTELRRYLGGRNRE